MSETPFFFRHEERSLFAVLHEPAVKSGRSTFVFCHPFAEEKLWAHRVFVAYARQLAAAGHAVLRFDHMGQGDSEGVFSQSSLSTAVADVRAAVDEVHRRVGDGPVSLLGLRLGATVASLAAEDTAAPIDRLVLWAPVVNGGRYMQELLRSNLATQLAIHKEVRVDRDALVASMQQGSTVNVDGYEMGYACYSEVSAVKLSASPKNFAGRCLVVNVDRQPNRPAPELEALAASYGSATLTAAVEEPFWKEILRWYSKAPNLFAVTDEWLCRQ